MRPITLKLIWCFVASLLLVSARPAQAQICRAADDSSYDMIEVVKSYALASDSVGRAVRDSLRIPAVASATNIVLISKEVTCKSANTAYQLAATGARQTLSGRVYVVQVGTRYVVWDPSYRYDTGQPKDVFMVFDSKWVKQSLF
jgi:hypothetical protein